MAHWIHFVISYLSIYSHSDSKISPNLPTNIKMSEEKKQEGNVGIAASIARKNILELHPYRCARDDYSSGVLLDANENAYGPTSLPSKCLDPYDNYNTLERYPDPYQIPLKELYAAYRGHGLKPENIFVGVGSDEAIDLLMRIFCRPAQDNILITPPTYGMYKVCAKVNDVSLVSVPLTADFDIRVPEVCMRVVRCIKTRLLDNVLTGIYNQFAQHFRCWTLQQMRPNCYLFAVLVILLVRRFLYRKLRRSPPVLSTKAWLSWTKPMWILVTREARSNW